MRDRQACDAVVVRSEPELNELVVVVVLPLLLVVLVLVLGVVLVLVRKREHKGLAAGGSCHWYPRRTFDR